MADLLLLLKKVRSFGYWLLVIWANTITVKGEYSMTFYTGGLFLADTQAHVNYRLVGTLGDTGTQELGNDYLAMNSVETFIHDGDVGLMVKLILSHDNSAGLFGFPGPGWYLEKVEITDAIRGIFYDAPCNEWIRIPIILWIYNFTLPTWPDEGTPVPATDQGTVISNVAQASTDPVTQVVSSAVNRLSTLSGGIDLSTDPIPQTVTWASNPPMSTMSSTDPVVPTVTSEEMSPRSTMSHDFGPSRDPVPQAGVSSHNPLGLTSAGFGPSTDPTLQIDITAGIPLIMTSSAGFDPSADPTLQRDITAGIPLIMTSSAGFDPSADPTLQSDITAGIPLMLDPSAGLDPSEILLTQMLMQLNNISTSTDLNASLHIIDDVVNTAIQQDIFNLEQTVNVAGAALEAYESVLNNVADAEADINADLSDVLGVMDGLSQMLSQGLVHSNQTSVIVSTDSVSVAAGQLFPPEQGMSDVDLGVDVAGVLDLAGVDEDTLTQNDYVNLVVLEDITPFLHEQADEDWVNMPIVSVGINDITGNRSHGEEASFVTTLSNVNNDPPKEDAIYCLNTTELYTVNFAYTIASSESAYRFDLVYPTLAMFAGVRVRYGAVPTELLNDLHIYQEAHDLQSEESGNLDLYWELTGGSALEIFIYENQMLPDTTLYIIIDLQNTTDSDDKFCVESIAIEPRIYEHGIWIPDPTSHVMEVSTFEVVEFRSSVFGALSANLHIPPNTINVTHVFDNFEELLIESPVVFTAVTNLLVTYILASLAALYFDRIDKNLMSPFSMATSGEAMAKEGSGYTLLVVTGWKGMRRNTANVWLRLKGTETTSEEIRLDDGKRKHFRSGTASAFSVWMPASLGKPTELEVWHDNTGKHPHWFLDKVLIKETAGNESWMFICKSWLSNLEGDGRIRRRIPELSQDSKYGHYLKGLSGNVFKRHLIASVLRKHSRSQYTRTQRMAIVVMMFFLVMVSNAMWYTTEERAGTSFKVSLGIIRLGWSEFYAGLMTILTVYPVTLLVAEIFRRRKDPSLTKTWLKNKSKEERWLISEDADLGVLPGWMVWIAWLLVLGAILGSVFVVILYSLEWGGDKAEGWLGSFLLALCEILLLTDPFLLIILYLVIERIRSEVVSKAMENSRNNTIDEELDEETRRLHATYVVNKRMITTLADIVFYVAYLCLVMSVSDEVGGRLAFRQTQNVKDNLPVHSNVTTFHKFYVWAEELRGILYETRDYRGEPIHVTESMFVKLVHYRVMPMQMRQLRVQEALCGKIEWLYPDLIHDGRCLPSYTKDSEDLLSYVPGWSYPTNGSTGTAFTYTDTPSGEFWGDIATYSTGGYIQVFGHSDSASFSALGSLIKNRWTDEKTRGIIVDTVLFNVNTNLFTLIKYVFEVPASGGLVTTRHIESVRLYMYVGEQGLILIVLQLLWFLVFIITTIREIRKMIKQKKNYFLEAWNSVTLLNIVIVCFTMASFGVKTVYIQMTIEEVKTNIGGALSFDKVLFWSQVYSVGMGIICFITIISMLRLLNLNKHIAILGATIRSAGSSLLAFASIILVYVAGSLGLFYVTYGYQHEHFRNMAKSGTTMLSTSLGQLSYGTLFEGNADSFSRIVFSLYMVVMIFFMINMFIALINDAYSHISGDTSQYTYDKELVDHVWRKIMHIWDSMTRAQATLHIRDMNCGNVPTQEMNCDPPVESYSVGHVNIIPADDPATKAPGHLQITTEDGQV